MTELQTVAAGWRQGFQPGYTDGYRVGASEAIRVRMPEERYAMRKMKVVYVPQGYDAMDIGVAESLQRLVKDCVCAPAAEMLEIVSQVKPDLVLVMNGLHTFPATHHEHLDQIRKNGIKTAVWVADDPYFTDETARNSLHYDYVFTHELNCITFYQAQGLHHVHYLPLAMNPEMFQPLRVHPMYLSDICFIGNAFWNRVELMDELAPFLATKTTVIAGGQWERLKNYALLEDFIIPRWVSAAEAVNYYNGAKIVINMHRPTAAGSDNHNGRNIQASSINPRTYEIAGCAALQMIDARQDVARQYTPGYDIIVFDSATDLQNKLEYYLQHEEERRLIALRSYMTTRSRHSYDKRLMQLLDIVSAHN